MKISKFFLATLVFAMLLLHVPGTARDGSKASDPGDCYSRQEVDALIESVQGILLAQQARIGSLQDLTLKQQGQIATLLKLAESQQMQITAQAGEISGLYGLSADRQKREVPGEIEQTPPTPRLVMNHVR
ncbi:MAG: hypothetical protein ABFD98_15110 [Syntrophobacteraceae bacterium]|nr:hypothetical protein [Desulfobacteraceae bacterium]